MPSKLYVVRHAQGYHNLGHQYWSLPDPLLTEEGRRQCLKLKLSFPSNSEIDLIVTSPMRRAIYTGLDTFGFVLNDHPGRQLIALPSLQELSDFPCDVGSEIHDLQNEVNQGNLPVDLTFVEKGWRNKTGIYEPTVQKIRDRALYIRRWLKARPEKEIVVVSHGGFLHFLTDDWEDGCKYEATGWANTECRTYEFLPDGNDSELEDAMIQETVESRQCRGKFGPPPTRASQKELCGLILQGWADQGYAIREGNSVEDEIKLR